MFQKSKVKKELIRTEQDDKKLIKCPYIFTASNVYKDTFFLNSRAHTTQYNLQYVKLSQMSGLHVLSKNSSETIEWNNIEEKKHKKVHFNISNNLVITKENNNIIAETPEFSFRSNSPYCSQTLYDSLKSGNFHDFTNIIQSLAKRSTYSTQPQISECLTMSNSEKTMSGLDEEIDCSKISQDINQSFQDLKNISLNNQNKLATIASDKSVLLKSELEQDEVDILSSKCENYRFTLSQHNLYERQLIKKSIFISNVTTNFISQKEISGLQIDTDVTLSGLNMLNLNNISHSRLNHNNIYFPGEITPIRNTNICDIKKENQFKNITEIFKSGYNIKEKNIVLKESFNNKSLNKNYLSDNVTPTLSSAVSTCSIQNLDCTNQDLHEQLEMKYLYNSENSSMISKRSKNLSLQISEKKSSYNIEMLSLEIHGNEFIENCSLKYKNQTMISIASQNVENKFKEFHSQSILLSLPLSEDNVEYMLLPSSVLLTNYCCEYDKAYTKKDLKPTPYRNYYSNKIINSLKEHFDNVITPKQSLEVFFQASDDIFEQLDVDLHATIDNILLMLEI